MKIDYEKVLNPSQLEAVVQTEGSFLIIAGAGSGKTRTLVYRVARLVESGIPPESILLLTFTRKASSEMLFRASLVLDDRCARVSGGTFHSVANLLLRRYGSIIGVPSGYTIMDAADAADCINQVKNEKEFGKKYKNFPRKSTLMSILSLSANKRTPVEFVLAKSHSQFLDFADEIREIQCGYKDRKKKFGLLDYDDLLVYFKELLEDKETRETIVKQYRYVMVDEFQDTNILQAEIVALLGDGHQNVMAVGDPAQSIYSFRGAHYQNTFQFENYFPSLKIIKLEENYRSTRKVLDVCNAIMTPAKEKYSKELFTKTKEGKELPVIVGNENSTDEACFIADKVEEIVCETGIRLNEIAVLFRNSFHAFELELELNKRRISYVKFGGFKFVETAHVKDIVAHLRILANVKDSVSWHRLLMLQEGMGPKTAEKVFRQIQSAENPFAFTKLKGLPKFQPVLKELEELFAYFTKTDRTPAQMIERLLEYYYPLLECKYDDHPKRKKDLDQFLAIAGKYDNLEQLISDLSLDPPNTARNGNWVDPKVSGDHLVLSTVHSSKGLEWDTVFVIGANENSFPNFYAMEVEEDFEEERRLFYVAATRAKERLFFTFSANKKDRNGGYYPVSPSPFLDPIIGKNIVNRIGSWGF